MNFKKEALRMLIFFSIAIILPLLVSTISYFKNNSKISKSIGNINKIVMALDNLYNDIDRYPTNNEGLNILISDKYIKKWKGPYINSASLVDSWGTDFIYKYIKGTDGKQYLIIGSAGNNQLWETEIVKLKSMQRSGDDLIIWKNIPGAGKRNNQ